MITCVIPELRFSKVWRALHRENMESRATIAFIEWLEKQLGASFVFDARKVPSGEEDLLDLHTLARKLYRAGILRAYYPGKMFADEPPYFEWVAEFSGKELGSEHSIAGGSSLESSRAALTAALAEALERHLWFTQTKYPIWTSPARLSDDFLHPERFTGFSRAQRDAHSFLSLRPDATYTWIRGYSWISNKKVWVPAQAVSGCADFQRERKTRGEPLIVHSNTNGLATAPTREEAVLAGALELIERDAFMIMWLNQLPLPRVDLHHLAQQSEVVAKLLHLCTQYRLTPSVVRLITDAPAYAVCAVLEDESGFSPHVTVGLKAHRNLGYAVEKAMLEALRARKVVRGGHLAKQWDPERKASDIGHFDRVLYWTEQNRWEQLAFLTQGPLQSYEEVWEKDAAPQHLERVVSWCRRKDYELASVQLTKPNTEIPWWVEMTIMPDLQPIHLHEWLPYIGGARLQEIPREFGYEPREPFTDGPHPFI